MEIPNLNPLRDQRMEAVALLHQIWLKGRLCRGFLAQGLDPPLETKKQLNQQADKRGTAPAPLSPFVATQLAGKPS